MKKKVLIPLLIGMMVLMTGCTSSAISQLSEKMNFPKSGSTADAKENEENTISSEKILDSVKSAFSGLAYVHLVDTTEMNQVITQKSEYTVSLEAQEKTIYEKEAYYQDGAITYELENYYVSTPSSLDSYSCYKSSEEDETQDWYYTNYTEQSDIEEDLSGYETCRQDYIPELFDKYAIAAITCETCKWQGIECYRLFYDSSVVSNATVEETVTMYVRTDNFYPIQVVRNQNLSGTNQVTTVVLTDHNSNPTFSVPQEVIDNAALHIKTED